MIQRGILRCRGLHKLLLVEEFNDLGAVVSCLHCDLTFQMGEDTLEERYLAFSHVSSDGPEGDLALFALATFIEGNIKTEGPDGNV